jgi:hypothetical protein
MVVLQTTQKLQLSFPSLELSDHLPHIIAYHRRRSIALSVSVESDHVAIYLSSLAHSIDQTYSTHIKNIYVKCDRVIGIQAIESRDAFVAIIEIERIVYALFIDVDGNVANKCELPGIYDVTSFDIDQNRLELIVAATSKSLGVIYSFSLRSSTSPYDSSKIFHCIYRYHFVFDNIITEIHSFDIIGLTLMMTSSRDIIGIDTATLERVIRIPRDQFLFEPQRLWIDKYGHSFVIYCVNRSNSREVLEYWTMPSTNRECSCARFSRVSIQLSSTLSQVYIETVGRGKTCIMILDTKKQLQVWCPNETSDICRLSAEMSFSSSITSPLPAINLTAKFKNASALSHALPDSVDATASFQVSSDISLDEKSDSISTDRSEPIPATDLFLIANIESRSGNSISHPACVLYFADLLSSALAMIICTGNEVSVNAIYFNQIDPTAVINTPSKFLSEDNVSDDEVSKNLTSRLLEESAVSRQPSIITENDGTNVPSEPMIEYRSHDGIYETQPVCSYECEVIANQQVFHFQPLLVSDDKDASQTYKPSVPASNLLVSPQNGRVQSSDFKDDDVKDKVVVFQKSCPYFTLKLLTNGKSYEECDIILGLNRSNIHLLHLEDQPMAFENPIFIEKACLLHRARAIAVVSTIQECFLCDLDGDLAPLHIDFDRRPQSTVVCLTAFDIQFDCFDETSTQATSSVGNFVLVMLGDSDGRVHYAVCELNEQFWAIVSIGIYDCPSNSSMSIHSILSTGNSSLNLFRITREKKKTSHLELPKQGSSIVIIGKDGEVLVVKPLFSDAMNAIDQAGSSKASLSQSSSFQKFTLNWKLVGILSCFSSISLPSKPLLVTSAAIDPLCQTLLIGSTSGVLEIWRVPGILRLAEHSAVGGINLDIMKPHEEALHTLDRPSWIVRGHHDSVNSCRCWSQKLIEPEMMNQLDYLESAYLDSMSLLSSADNADMIASFYSYKAYIQQIAQSSTLTTSSADKSLILWRFDLLVIKISGRYVVELQPIPCRIFHFSGIPYDGISCPFSSNVWSIDAIIDGTLQTLARGQLHTFIKKAEVNITRDPVVLDDNTVNMTAIRISTHRVLPSSIPSSTNVNMIIGVPIVLANDLSKPLRLLESLNTLRSSFDLFDTKQENFLADALLENWYSRPGNAHEVVHNEAKLATAKATASNELTSTRKKSIHVKNLTQTTRMHAIVSKVSLSLDALPNAVDTEDFDLSLDEKKTKISARGIRLIVDNDAIAKLNDPNPQKKAKLVVDRAEDDSNIYLSRPATASSFNDSRLGSRRNSASARLPCLSPINDDFSPKISRAVIIPTQAIPYDHSFDGTTSTSIFLENLEKSSNDMASPQKGEKESKYKLTKSYLLMKAVYDRNRARMKSRERKYSKNVTYVSKSNLEKRVALLNESSNKEDVGTQSSIHSSKLFVAPISSENSNMHNPLDKIDTNKQEVETGTALVESIASNLNENRVQKLIVGSAVTAMKSPKKYFAQSPTQLKKPVKKLVKAAVEKVENDLQALTITAEALDDSTIATTLTGQSLYDYDFINRFGDNNEADLTKTPAFDQAMTDDDTNIMQNLRKIHGIHVPLLSSGLGDDQSSTNDSNSLKNNMDIQPTKPDQQLPAKQAQALISPKGLFKVLTLNDSDHVTAVPHTYFDRSAKPIVVQRTQRAYVARLIKGSGNYSSVNTTSNYIGRQLFVMPKFMPMNDLTMDDDISIDDESNLTGLKHMHIPGILNDKATMSTPSSPSTTKKPSSAHDNKDDMASKFISKFGSGVNASCTIIYVKESMVTIEASTSVSGTIIVMIQNALTYSEETSELIPAPLPAKALFNTKKKAEVLENISHEASFVQYVEIGVEANAKETVCFQGLEPATSYHAYAFAIINGGHIKMMYDKFIATRSSFTTDVEEVEIDWKALSSEEREIELRVAVQCTTIQSAYAFNAGKAQGLPIPSDDDIQYRHGNTAENIVAMKKYEAFCTWYIGEADSVSAHPPVSKARKDFLFQEILFHLTDDHLLDFYVNNEILSGDDAYFLKASALELMSKKLTSISLLDESASSQKPPSSQQLTRSRSSISLRASSANVTLSAADSQLLKDFISNQAYLAFRSWYRGGYRFYQFSEKILQKSQPPDSLMSPDSAVSHASSIGYSQVSSMSSQDYSNCNTIEDCLKVRRNQRSEFLRDRLQLFGEGMVALQQLMDGYVYMRKHKLTEKSIIVRRAELTAQDISAIAAGYVLRDLIIKLAEGHPNLDTSSKSTQAILMALGDPSLQVIGGIDPFQAIHTALFVPKSILYDIECMPETSRHPMKPWMLCTLEEQALELMLACSLDRIAELAILDGIVVPDPEDYYVDSYVDMNRAVVWNDFIMWYLGDERLATVPGRGIPSLARVTFAEDWEISVVLEDQYIHDQMQEQGWFDADIDHDPTSEATNTAYSSLSRQEILQIYEGYVQRDIGTALRIAMLKRYLQVIMSSRQSSMTYHLFPFISKPLTKRYIFPLHTACPFIPPMEMPMKRIQVFPSQSIEAYHIDEICQWYSEEELIDDDLLMQAAEQVGRKKKKYLDWIIKESERQRETWSGMLEEDKNASIERQYWKNIDQLIDKHERNLLGELDESSFDPKELIMKSNLAAGGPNNPDGDTLDEEHDGESSQQHEDEEEAMIKISHQVIELPRGIARRSIIDQDLPIDLNFHRTAEDANAWFASNDAIVLAYHYEHGNGAENDDELDELIREQQLAIEAAKRREEELQAKIREEKRSKHAEEEYQRRRAEQDRRLEEGAERRKAIREKFEDIKRQRELKQIEELRRKEYEEQQALLYQQQLLEQEARARQRAYEDQLAIQERLLMAEEEAYCRSVWREKRELQLMEHEDIQSQMTEQWQLMLEEQAERKRREHALIYEPFEAFDFKGRGDSSLTYKQLHRVLEPDASTSISKLPILPPVDIELMKDRIRQAIEDEKLRLAKMQYDAAYASYSVLQRSKDRNLPKKALREEKLMTVHPVMLKLMKKADQTVARLQHDRIAIKEYVDSDALFGNASFLQSTLPLALANGDQPNDQPATMSSSNPPSRKAERAKNANNNSSTKQRKKAAAVKEVVSAAKSKEEDGFGIIRGSMKPMTVSDSAPRIITKKRDVKILSKAYLFPSSSSSFPSTKALPTLTAEESTLDLGEYSSAKRLDEDSEAMRTALEPQTRTPASIKHLPISDDASTA